MARDLRTEENANVVLSASRIGPLRHMAPVRPRRAPVVRPLFIPSRTPWLPQSRLGWFACATLFALDVAPVVFIVTQLWGRP